MWAEFFYIKLLFFWVFIRYNKHQMLKKLLVFCFVCIMSYAALAESGAVKNIAMSATDVVKLAGDLVYTGRYDQAQDILIKMPQTNNLPVEIERWYLLAQIEQRKGNIDEAIKIYRRILDDQPDLVKIRYELALCYMEKEQWYRADYNLRLAMAGKDIPDNIKQAMMYYRYIIRQNKNWNIWFNFGAAPDNNVNQAVGGKECVVVDNSGTLWCRDLPEPEKVIGKNLLLGGNYEFKLSDHWRWKNEGTVYMNVYEKHIYDDLYLSASSGPRYVWDKGDAWLSGIISRRWYGWDKYNWSYGGRLHVNYDFTRKFSGGVSLRTMKNLYDEYGDYMDGYTYSFSPHVSYSLDSTKYFILRCNLDKDTAKADAYANNRYGFGIGFGSVLPYGFNIYLEPNLSWAKYKGERIYVENGLQKLGRERDFMQRYSISLSNNNFDVWGFVPTITVSYFNKDSNIHSREYEKWTAEFTFHQRF